jgi:hypothetical protein
MTELPVSFWFLYLFGISGWLIFVLGNMKSYQNSNLVPRIKDGTAYMETKKFFWGGFKDFIEDRWIPLAIGFIAITILTNIIQDGGIETILGVLPGDWNWLIKEGIPMKSQIPMIEFITFICGMSIEIITNFISRIFSKNGVKK